MCPPYTQTPLWRHCSSDSNHVQLFFFFFSEKRIRPFYGEAISISTFPFPMIPPPGILMNDNPTSLPSPPPHHSPSIAVSGPQRHLNAESRSSFLADLATFAVRPWKKVPPHTFCLWQEPFATDDWQRRTSLLELFAGRPSLVLNIPSMPGGCMSQCGAVSKINNPFPFLFLCLLFIYTQPVLMSSSPPSRCWLLIVRMIEIGKNLRWLHALSPAVMGY